MKLLLTAILKDDTEIKMAERMLASFMPYFQGLAVGITGTSGKTQELKALVEKYHGTYVRTTPETHPDIYHEGKFANFAEARNVVFRLAEEMQKTDKYDYWSWADVDDVLIHGEELQECVKRAKDLNLDSVFFTYWYSVLMDEKGAIRDVAIEHLRERLLKPGMFKWVSRLHEIAVPKDGKYEPKHSLYDLNPQEGRNTVWAHLTDETRVTDAMKRNIVLLELQRADEIAKDQNDPRTIFYLAKTHYDMRTPEDYKISEKLLVEYLGLSGWAEERSFAWEYLGNIHCIFGRHKEAKDCYFEASKEFGNRHMNYLLIAREYAELNLFEESDFWLDTALKMDEPKARTTIGNPSDIKFLAASLKYNQAIRQSKLDDAIYWYQVRLKVMNDPDDDALKALKEAKELNEQAKNVFSFAKWLKDQGHLKKIPALLESLPLELGREAFAFYIANEVREPRTWGKNEIAYYASFGSEHFEQWSRNSLSKGIGGSETAVIRLAEEWVKKGYKVTIFGDPREEEGEINGVMYRPYYEINWRDKFNILILWRSPYFIDRVESASQLYVDLHDVASQLDWTEERMKKVDKVFFKSIYHRKMVPKLPEEKARVIGNGI
jgi:tetratricopeptide (TPR) repeat protein